jgi:hypothetical protein
MARTREGVICDLRSAVLVLISDSISGHYSIRSKIFDSSPYRRLLIE